MIFRVESSTSNPKDLTYSEISTYCLEPSGLHIQNLREEALEGYVMGLAPHICGFPLSFIHIVVTSLNLVEDPVVEGIEVGNVGPLGSVWVGVGDGDAVVLRDGIATSDAGVHEGSLPGRVHVLLLVGEGIELVLPLIRRLWSDLVLREETDCSIGSLLSERGSEGRLSPEAVDRF